jgi:hypothetical protein
MVVAVLAMVASCAGESGLPAPLRQHLEQELEREITGTDWLAFALAFPIVAAGLASFFGMLKFRPHSRSLSIAASLAALLFQPLLGSTVEPGIATALWYLSHMLYGAVLGISYCPPVSIWFDEKLLDGTDIRSSTSL